MELTSLASAVKTSNVGATTGFTMETNEFAFRVLSDGLYQNKIGSMVREVSCNALDSHVMAGCADRPVRIHLPDMYEPYFSVQDFGIGLDDYGVRDTFATYFKSTKRTDNKAVGAFGLGSKTPFAYTDAFQITAIKDGKRRVYSAFLNESGVPAIANMGGEESATYVVTDNDGNPVSEILDQWTATDEENGVLITVPVTSSGDFNKFRMEVQNQLAFFPVKPELLNCNSIEWMDWERAGQYMNLDRILVGEYKYGSNFSGLWVVQGPVGYRADVAELNKHLSADNREFLDIISQCAILRFELGELEVTPSREGLSYGKKTIAAIEALLDAGRDGLKSQIQEQVNSLGDAWATATGINANNTLRRLAGITKATFEAEGYYKSGGFYFLDLERIANLEGLGDADEESTPEVALGFDATWDQSGVDDEDDDRADDEDEEETDKPKLADLLNLQFRQYTRQSVSRRGRVKKWMQGSVGRHAKADASFTVLVRDTDNKPVVRIREYMSGLSGHNLQVYVLQNRNGGPVTAQELEAIKARIGESWTPDLMSEVELPARETSGYRSGYKCPTAYTFHPGNDMYDTGDWEREYDKLKDFDGAYYVIVDRCRTSVSSADRIAFDMARAGLLDRPVMAIRRKDADKLADNPEWIPLSSKTKEVIESVKSNVSLHNAVKLTACEVAGVECMDANVAELLRKECEAGNIPESSPLHRLFRLFRTIDKAKVRAKSRGMNSITEMALRYAGVSLDESEMEKAINNRVAKLAAPVKDAYPLLGFIRSSRETRWECPTTQAAHIMAYINATTGASAPV